MAGKLMNRFTYYSITYQLRDQPKLKRHVICYFLQKIWHVLKLYYGYHWWDTDYIEFDVWFRHRLDLVLYFFRPFKLHWFSWAWHRKFRTTDLYIVIIFYGAFLAATCGILIKMCRKCWFNRGWQPPACSTYQNTTTISPEQDQHPLSYYKPY